MKAHMSCTEAMVPATRIFFHYRCHNSITMSYKSLALPIQTLVVSLKRIVMLFVLALVSN